MGDIVIGSNRLDHCNRIPNLLPNPAAALVHAPSRQARSILANEPESADWGSGSAFGPAAVLSPPQSGPTPPSPTATH